MLHGQVLIDNANIMVATADTGQRALVIDPTHTQLQITVPISEAACRDLARALNGPTPAHKAKRPNPMPTSPPPGFAVPETRTKP